MGLFPDRTRQPSSILVERARGVKPRANVKLYATFVESNLTWPRSALIWRFARHRS
jgi:hypothetical protein